MKRVENNSLDYSDELSGKNKNIKINVHIKRLVRRFFLSFFKKKANKKNIIDLFLFVSITCCIVSFGYSVQKNIFQKNSKASTDTQSIAPIYNSITKVVTKLPIAYKGIEIPPNIIDEAKKEFPNIDKSERDKTYLIDKISRYYIYADALKEAGENVSYVNSFEDLKKQVFVLEYKVDKLLVKNMTFAYVLAQTVGPTIEHSNLVRQKYTDQNAINQKAIEILEKYRKKLIDNPNDYENILEEALKDEDLMFLNANNKNSISVRNNYRINDLLFPFEKDRINNLIFTQKLNIVSEVLPINNKSGNDSIIGYMIIMPISIVEAKNKSINDLVKNSVSFILF